MQLHKRIMRSMVIEKKFTEARKNMQVFDKAATSKGFKGSTLSMFAARKSPVGKGNHIRTEVQLKPKE